MKRTLTVIAATVIFSSGAGCGDTSQKNDARPEATNPVLSSTEIHPGYVWQDLGSGIYLHTRRDPLAGPVDGNSVVIVNDADVFVVDTHIDPAAARAVIERIGSITDRPVTHVVNTHWHDDHVNGNHAYRQAFPGVRIVAHRATLASLEKEWEPMEAQRKAAYANVSPERIVAMADSIEAGDPDRATMFRVYAGYVEALKPELGSMELVYPDQVFDDSLRFDRSGRTIVVKWLGRGNTDGDAVVWLPENRVLVTGDLVVYPIPFAYDSPVSDWIETLDRLAAFPAVTIVPGHGPAQRGAGYIDQVRQLLDATVAAVRDAHDAGTELSDLQAVVDLTGQEQLFTEGDAMRRHAWHTYFITPGLNSAWASLGYELPEPE